MDLPFDEEFINELSQLFGAQDEGAQDDGVQGLQCCDIEIDFSSLSNICHLLPKPLLVTGLLTQWMRLHFGDSDNLDETFLSEYIWNENINETRIVIDSVYKFRPELTEFRPGIFIKRSPWQVIRYGIDDRKMVTANSHRIPKYNSFIKGSHVLFCVGGESAEVELLATEVYRELMMFGPAARSTFGFLRFVVSEIGEVNLLEEATENFVVPVVVSYGAQDVWQICPPSVQKLNFLRNFRHGGF